MDKLQKYKPSDKMIDLISDNYSLLQVMSRFGLSLGFGEKSVKEVCELNNVDYRTFLAVVNFIFDGYSQMDGKDADISIPALIDYLKQSHRFFLDFYLPGIRRKLQEAIDPQNEIAFLVLKFFDGYTNEVRKHMDFEDDTVFKYVDTLLQGKIPPKGFKINTFSRHHDQVGEKLSELKNIIIKYCPSKDNENLLNAALFDIYECEAELESHCKVEDYIFVPAIVNLERRVKAHEEQ